MWVWLRILFRVLAAVLLAGAIYLVVMKPTATVASESLLTKLDVQVQCASVWSQWTHNAKPAQLALNGQALSAVPEAQSSCASASTTIKHVAEGGAVAAAFLGIVSLKRARPRRALP
jgi:hypothetical protein